MDRDRAARLWNTALLLLVIVALVWTFVLIFTSPNDPSVPEPMRVANFFSFFTIWSNILVGVVAATLAVDPHRDGRLWRVLHLDAVLMITVTGIVHLVALRPISDLTGAHAVTDNLLHVAVPLGGLVGWLLFAPRPRIDRPTVLWGLAIPVVWLVFTMVRGEIVEWYPYPFIDVNEIGYPRTLINVAVVAVLFLMLGAAASQLERWLRTRNREQSAVT